MKTYLITIQTTGYITYRVKATDKGDACSKIDGSTSKDVVVEEESYGEFSHHHDNWEDWEIEEYED